MMVWLLMALPMVASVVLMVSVAAVTLTCVFSVMDSGASTVAGCATSSLAVAVKVPKPVEVTVMVYVPGRSSWKLYSPWLFDRVLVLKPTAGFARLTAAPEMMAPVGSETTPRKEVVAVWAKSETGTQPIRSRRPRRTRRKLDLTRRRKDSPASQQQMSMRGRSAGVEIRFRRPQHQLWMKRG